MIINNEKEVAEAHERFNRLYDQWPKPLPGGPVQKELDEIAQALDDWYAKHGKRGRK